MSWKNLNLIVCLLLTHTTQDARRGTQQLVRAYAHTYFLPTLTAIHTAAVGAIMGMAMLVHNKNNKYTFLHWKLFEAAWRKRSVKRKA